jgi:hypothetical protein
MTDKLFVYGQSMMALIDPMIGIDGEPISASFSSQPNLQVFNWENVKVSDKALIRTKATSLGLEEQD